MNIKENANNVNENFFTPLEREVILLWLQLSTLVICHGPQPKILW
jgi:hypothetical protein